MRTLNCVYPAYVCTYVCAKLRTMYDPCVTFLMY